MIIRVGVQVIDNDNVAHYLFKRISVNTIEKTSDCITYIAILVYWCAHASTKNRNYQYVEIKLTVIKQKWRSMLFI